MTSFRSSVLLLCFLVVPACTCADKKTPTDQLSTPNASTSRVLQPLPNAPSLDVAPESLPGAGQALAVVAARPQGNQQGEVRPTVTFSRPVKSLEMVEAQRAADAAKPFAKIDPPLAGEWRWLGSASAEFVPAGAVPYSTTFTVTVMKGLAALDGATMAEDYSFSFSTPRLELQDVRPVRNDRWVTPDATISLLFNQPVKASELESAVRLMIVGGERVPVKVVKEVSILDERRAAQAAERAPRYEVERDRGNRQMRYTLKPARALPLATGFSMSFDATLHGSQGALTMVTTDAVSWHTYGPMKVEGARFCSGDYRCPYGPLVISTSNGAELESLKSRLTITPPVEIDWDTSSIFVPDDEWEMTGRSPTVSVNGKFKPGIDYTVTVASGVTDVFKQAAGADLKSTVHTDDLTPQLVTGNYLGVIEATAKAPVLPVEVANLATLTTQMWKLSIPELARSIAQPGYSKNSGVTRAPDFQETQKLKYPKNVARVHPLELNKVFGASSKKGVALVSVTSSSLEYQPPGGFRQLVQVTDLAAHIKIAPKASLAWVTRMSDGSVVPDADVTVYNQLGEQVWAGKTNAEGFADVPGATSLKLNAPKYSWEYPFALVVAQKDDDLSATANTWAGGVEPYEFGLSQGWEGERPDSTGFMFTDRGIYRPGDEVFVKGVARYRVVGELRAPAANSAFQLTASDSRGESIKTETVKVTPFGTFSTKFTIPKEAPTGFFSVNAKASLNGSDVSVATNFRVEEYRAPQFRVDVSPTKDSMVAGDAFEGSISARYLFGGAMNDVPVKWSVQRSSTSFSAEVAPDFTFTQETWWWDDHAPSDASGFFASGEGRADSHGSITVKAGTTEAPGEKPYVYTLEGEATDVNRQSVADRASVTVHPASYYVGLRSPAYFMQVGTEYGLETLVVDTAGKRTAGKSVVATVTSRTWKSVKKKDASGGFSTVSEPEEKEVKKCELTSADTAVPCKFKPDSAGFYILRATVKDEQSRTHTASMGLYATGSDWVAWQRSDTDRVELITDKTKYDVGDVAKVLIKSPYPQAKAMVTVEREGVLSRRLVDLKGSVVTIEVPITEDMVPNVFAGVLIMHPREAQGGIESGDDPGRPNARIGLVKLNVEKKSKRLAVTVSTDQKSYHPRDKVNVSIDVKDSAGKPTNGEVTLYVVDEAVLRLTNYQVPDPIASIYPDRPLSVRLGEPLLHLVRARRHGEKGESQGGGGGVSGEGAGFRNQFKTTVHFNPSLSLENGTAKTSFTLPDNLTSFRLMAVVITQADRFGSGEASVQVNKPVMALPALPRFARVNDEFEAGVVVHSHGATGEGTVTAQVEGGVQLTSPAQQQVALAEGAPKEVRFHFKGLKAGPAKFRFKVSNGPDSDGVEETLPIELPVEVDAVATYGDTTDQRVEGVVPPKDVWPDLGGLTVSLSSTSMSGFDRGFQQLIDYPYGCLEQQSSRLVPFIAMREIAGQFGIPWPGPNQKKLDQESEFNALLRTYLFGTLDVSDKRDPDDVINATVKSILALQDDDGSFRYWPDSMCADSWTSAYATLALARAKEVGFAVPQDRLTRAEGFLSKVVGGNCHPCELWCGDEKRVLASYVLARMKKPKPSSYAELYARRDKLSLFSRALLANAMFVGQGDRKQANALLQEILNFAKESPKGVHLEEVNSATYSTLFQSDTRTTGVVLQALTDIAPDHPYVGKMAKYLTSVRQGDGAWRSTQEAAWSLMGLTEVLRTKEKDTPDFVASVAMGAKELANQPFKGRSLNVQTKTIPMGELLSSAQGADQNLTFKKDGPGVLYYSALLKYAPKELPTKSLDNGLFVQRWFEPFEGGGQALTFNAGDLVRIRLRIGTNQERHWTAFEVPLPAGLEPVDTSLATSAKQARAPDEESAEAGAEYEGEGEGEGGSADPDEAAENPWAYRFWSPFNHLEMRDSRVIAFADHLPPGVHVVSFVARATTPGKYVLKPAKGTLMYEPEVWGRSEGGSFEVVIPTSVTTK